MKITATELMKKLKFIEEELHDIWLEQLIGLIMVKRLRKEIELNILQKV